MKRALTPYSPTTTSLATDRPQAVFSTTAAVAPEVDVVRWWRVLQRRRGLMAIVFVSVVVAIALATFLKPKSYTTEVRLIAGNGSTTAQTNPNADQNLPVLNALLTAGGVQSPETYSELLHETPVAREVVSRLGLNISPATLARAVSIKPVSGTSILGVAVKWSDPQTSAKIANTYANVFVDRERNLIAHQADSAIGFLQTQLPIAEQRLKTAQGQLAEYQTRNGIADLTQQTQAQLAQVAALDAKGSQAVLDGRQAQAQLASVLSQLATVPPTIEGQHNTNANPVQSQLDQQIATVTAQLDAARKQYTDEHPTVIALKSQLAGLENEAKKQSSTIDAGSTRVPNPVYESLQQQAATLRSQISADSSQESTARSQRAAMDPVVRALPERTQHIGALVREAKAAEAVYDTLEKKYDDAMLSRTTALSDVTITQSADAESATVEPNYVTNLAVAVIAGALLALGSAFVIEFFDDRFRTEEDVKERLGIPVLASIPALTTMNHTGARTGSWIDALAYESYFELVTALRYSSTEAPRSIAITSPRQGDGKSTIALNVAISMAQLNARVLIIDADLRRPTLHTKLGFANGRGLSDVLVGVCTLDAAVRESGHPGVLTLTSGTRSPNPVALLQGETFDRLLATARDQFDFVIIDAPALGPIIDGVILAMKADGAVLVVSATNTDGRAANSALDKLASVSAVNLIGVVLNNTKPEAHEYSEYYLANGSAPGGAITAEGGPALSS
jgi:capsular exopolysaccharide synthesis family protein